jgi:outer membrane lipopolysaccharide assembly protein LptE/RlpB
MSALRALLFVSLLAHTGWGCGYTPVNSALPFGQALILLEPITESSPMGLADQLTRSLLRHLSTSSMRLTADSTAATAMLKGRVISTRTRGASITATDRAAEAFVFDAKIELTLVNRQSGELLWSTTIPASEAFRQITGGGTGAIETETARRLAMGRLADTLALEIREQLLIASMAATPEES